MLIQPDTSSISPAKRALLEKYLRTNVRVTPRPASIIPRRRPDETIPLSFAQEQVWLHAQLAPDLPLYNEPVTIHYTGPLDTAALERAFNEILRRHEAWRTSFTIVDGQPIQIVAPDLLVSIPLIDLRQIPAEQREAEAIRIATKDAERPLDLTKAPLFRVNLMRIEDEKHRLYLTLSHIIFDGVAIYRVFLPELAALYKAFAAGQPSPLPELDFQYPDYACWQRNSNYGEKIARDLEYWRKQLAGDLPTLDLPVDRPRQPVQTFRGSMYPFILDGQLLNKLRFLSQREGVTLFQTLLASFAVLLHRYSGQDDIPIGTVTSGRDHPGTPALLGYFLNTIVLRMGLSGDLTFRELLTRARNATLEALAHDSVPFGTLVSDLKVPRDGSRNPLFQSMFTLEPPMPDVDPGWQLTQMDVDTGATKYDVYLELDERTDCLLARYHYSTDLFDLPTIVRMADEWRTLVAGAVERPDARLKDLPVLPAHERQQLLTEWNATEQVFPNVTIHELFETQVERSPNATAVECDGQWLTYADLNARANRLARHLKGLGAGPDTLVALCMDRSVEMVVGLLGILKSGAAYVPLDPAYPEERLRFVISDSRPLVVVTQQSRLDRFADHPQVVAIDSDWRSIAKYAANNLRPAADNGRLAYVIYTSGSTGTPKGVEIEHRSVVNFLTSMQREPGLTARDVVVAVTTIAFDIAGLEIYLPLVSGARVVIAPTDVARDATRLNNLLERSGATVMQGTPATWRLLLESGWKGSPRLKAFCGGEALPQDLAAALAERTAALWNLYGPTESTIWSTIHRVDAKPSGAIPIGRPIANTKTYLLDRHLNPVPVGITGELYIGGDGLARGYRNRLGLTAERFIPDPFGSAETRLYKTGDLARYRNDGQIEFLGRSDTQVKIRGFRVELGEIETALAKHPAVKAAVAEVRDVLPGDPRLTAYLIPTPGQEPDKIELREFLRLKLPEYMVPGTFVFMTELPLTPNGKVDRKALPSAMHGLHEQRNTIAARNEIEAQLIAIWESVLATTPIGVTDDFFALGGHSILAVRLFARIEKAFGKSIPLATLLKAPTIAQLAMILQGEEKANRWTSLVPIQRNGVLPAIFCVHGHYGEILFYRPLSQRLGDRQPFYALQAAAHAGGKRSHSTIEEMAEHYISEMKQARPHGPYYIAGYCFGSLIAFEMAQRLRREGEQVAFLGLFMGYESNDQFLHRLFKRVGRHAAQLERHRWAKVKNLAVNGTMKLKSVLWRRSYGVFRKILSPTSGYFRNVPEMNLQAAKRYQPQFYPGKMTVFMSGDLPSNFVLNPKTHLNGLDADSIDLRIVPGERDTMMMEPNAEELGRQLEECLRAAQDQK